MHSGRKVFTVVSLEESVFYWRQAISRGVCEPSIPSRLSPRWCHWGSTKFDGSFINFALHQYFLFCAIGCHNQRGLSSSGGWGGGGWRSLEFRQTVHSTNKHCRAACVLQRSWKMQASQSRWDRWQRTMAVSGISRWSSIWHSATTTKPRSCNCASKCPNSARNKTYYTSMCTWIQRPGMTFNTSVCSIFIVHRLGDSFWVAKYGPTDFSIFSCWINRAIDHASHLKKLHLQFLMLIFFMLGYFSQPNA